MVVEKRIIIWKRHILCHFHCFVFFMFSFPQIVLLLLLQVIGLFGYCDPYLYHIGRQNFDCLGNLTAVSLALSNKRPHEPQKEISQCLKSETISTPQVSCSRHDGCTCRTLITTQYGYKICEFVYKRFGMFIKGGHKSWGMSIFRRPTKLSY